MSQQTDETPKAGAPPRGQFFVSCQTCGTAIPFGDDELVQYARDGWPVCCDQTMRCDFQSDDKG